MKQTATATSSRSVEQTAPPQISFYLNEKSAGYSQSGYSSYGEAYNTPKFYHTSYSGSVMDYDYDDRHPSHHHTTPPPPATNVTFDCTKVGKGDNQHYLLLSKKHYRLPPLYQT